MNEIHGSHQDLSHAKTQERNPDLPSPPHSGQAVVTLNGTDHYLGRWNSPESKAEYDRLINEWLVRGRRLPERRDDASTDELMTKQLILGYYSHAVATMADEEVEKVKIALKPVREMYGETPASKFGPVAFQAVRRKFVEAGLSISTIRDRMGTIKRMVGFGVANELLPGDALHRLQAVPRSGAAGMASRLPRRYCRSPTSISTPYCPT